MPDGAVIWSWRWAAHVVVAWRPSAAHCVFCVAPEQKGAQSHGIFICIATVHLVQLTLTWTWRDRVNWILIVGSSWTLGKLIEVPTSSNPHPSRGCLYGDFLGSRTPSTLAAKWAGNTGTIVTLGSVFHSHRRHSFLLPDQRVWGPENSDGDVPLVHRGVLWGSSFQSDIFVALSPRCDI